MMATIFLSHSNLNNPQAMAVRDWLASEGWDDVFLDLDPERGIKAGERWQEALKRASSTCELVLFLVSPAWAASKWCLAEFLLAKQMNKRIFAAIDEEIPFDMIPVEMASEWQIVDLTAGAAMRDLPVASPAGEKPDVVRFTTDGLDRLKIGLLAAGLDPKFFPWPPEHDPHRPPYRGLRALEEEDAGIFFGRDGPIVDGLDLLRGLREAAPPRMLVILGASGGGKSSFMRAGLLPRLRRDSHHYRVLPVVRPHDAVLERDAGLTGALERALRAMSRPRPRAEIRKACATGAQAVAELIAPLVEQTTAETAPPHAHPSDRSGRGADPCRWCRRGASLPRPTPRSVAPRPAGDGGAHDDPIGQLRAASGCARARGHRPADLQSPTDAARRSWRGDPRPRPPPLRDGRGPSRSMVR